MVVAGHQREKLLGGHRCGVCHRFVERAAKAVADAVDHSRNDSNARAVSARHRCHHHFVGRQTARRLSGERLLVGVVVQHHRVGGNKFTVSSILLRVMSAKCKMQSAKCKVYFITYFFNRHEINLIN